MPAETRIAVLSDGLRYSGGCLIALVQRDEDLPGAALALMRASRDLLVLHVYGGAR